MASFNLFSSPKYWDWQNTTTELFPSSTQSLSLSLWIVSMNRH